MKIDIEEVDSKINLLLNYLKSIQNEDGSFNTMYLQPYYNPNKGWINFPVNAPLDLAISLLPLIKIKNKIIDKIALQGCTFLLKNSLQQKLWVYPPLSKEYLLFYDTESTSLSSYVIEHFCRPIANKNILNSCIVNNDYKLFITPKFPVNQLSIVSQVKLFSHNRVVKKARDFKTDLMRIDDFEFSITCNNLLYLGLNEKNKQIWESIKERIDNREIQLQYYPTLFHAIYFYARLYCYGKGIDIFLKKETADLYVDKLQKKLKENYSSMYKILFTNSLLLLDIEKKYCDMLIKSCIEDIEKEEFKKPTPYYSSNIKTDTQPGTNLPNTYFGSPAITCSLYLEFLNLYRKRFYGKYYGEE